ncbi:enoyl-CoA hydratase/isomerase family protein [Comamonas sp. 4034]|uniref:enoyl-CoA hydratase/isomerase family protein n=1 Tax=Comamonas sp. 4034 TaxID=3156455 RepID=UPI003D213E29
MTSTAPLLIQRQAGTVTLQFNRPEAFNALNVELAQEFAAAMRSLSADQGLRALVLQGAGKAFIAGGDLATLQANPTQGAKDLLEPLIEAATLMHQLHAPIIAQVHGAVAGAGLSLMMLCDFVLAAQGTRMNLAYINIGASCDIGASWTLPRIVGLRRALEIAMLGENLDADEALRLGLVNRVVPAAELQAATNALAERLANGPTQAYAQMRRLMRSGFERDLPTQLRAEGEAFLHCAQTHDLPEGINAFFAKRQPQFIGA